jgi:hypothetical protein
MPRRRQHARSSFIAVTIASLVAALAPVAPALAAGPVDVVFSFTGAEQSWTVPSGVTTIHVHLIGGKGASGGGYPGGVAHDVSGDLVVTPGSTIYVEVGGAGIGPTPGFNGGGARGIDGNLGTAAAGGGASDIRTISRSMSGTLDSRLIVAGGGGGAGNQMPGGHAGDRGNDETMGGQPGSNTFGGGAGGVGDKPGSTGALGVGGAGGTWCLTEAGCVPGGTAGGGGGGGYYGGGGGAGMSAQPVVQVSGSGGGGSAYAGNATNVSIGHAQLDPSITITYLAGDDPDPTTGPEFGVVDATIAMAESTICIELSTAAVDFGTSQFGQVGVAGSPEIVVTNCGIGPQALFARATAAVGPDAEWILVTGSATCADTLELGEYHLWLTDSQTLDDTWGIGLGNTLLGSGAADSSASYAPSIDTPCPGSPGAGQQMSMQIVFTAAEAVP